MNDDAMDGDDNPDIVSRFVSWLGVGCLLLCVVVLLAVAVLVPMMLWWN